MPTDCNTLKHQPHTPTGSYKHRAPSKPKPKNPLKTSAKPITSKKHNNLTLHDWMTVFSYLDSHTQEYHRRRLLNILRHSGQEFWNLPNQYSHAN